jgi:hypothetical protein
MVISFKDPSRNCVLFCIFFSIPHKQNTCSTPKGLQKGLCRWSRRSGDTRRATWSGTRSGKRHDCASRVRSNSFPLLPVFIPTPHSAPHLSPSPSPEPSPERPSALPEPIPPASPRLSADAVDPHRLSDPEPLPGRRGGRV